MHVDDAAHEIERVGAFVDEDRIRRSLTMVRRTPSAPW
jgi:hypothetical protein